MTSCAALAVRFIRAEAECAREASRSCDELAAPPFHLLHGEYTGDEEVAAPSSAALRSPASWGYAGVEGAATPRMPPVVSTTSRKSTQEKRREATPSSPCTVVSPARSGSKGIDGEVEGDRNFR